MNNNYYYYVFSFVFSPERDVWILYEILQLLLQGGVVGSCLHKIELELKS